MSNNGHVGTQGEFRGDFTRDTFDPSKHFSRVLMQQGRVQLDADWNEQTSILLHYLHTLAAGLIGPHGGPGDGFKIQDKDKDNKPYTRKFAISPGHYYVGGVLCENASTEPVLYDSQTDFRLEDEDKLSADGNYLVYLDVWERHVNCLQDFYDDNPSICEVALKGPDTATRARIVWQVKVLETSLVIGDLKTKNPDSDYQKFLAELNVKKLVKPGTGQLRARAKKAEGQDDACCISPESRYRGAENQLYRVEIHRAGGAWDGKDGTKSSAATFKWSRENASVAFPVRKLVTSSDGTTTVSLESLGRDALYSLKEGDWIEIVDDDYILQNGSEPLLQVDTINRDDNEVTLKGTTKSQVGENPAKHPLLRRWDHKGGDPKSGGLTIDDDGAALLHEESNDKGWLNLENGIQIQFPPQTTTANYRTGDYWLIPARVATGDVEWPGTVDKPESRPPHGIQHYYAPLWIVSVKPSGEVTADPGDDCRRKFGPLTS